MGPDDWTSAAYWRLAWPGLGGKPFMTSPFSGIAQTPPIHLRASQTALREVQLRRVEDVPGGGQDFAPFEVGPGVAGADGDELKDARDRGSNRSCSGCSRRG